MKMNERRTIIWSSIAIALIITADYIVINAFPALTGPLIIIGYICVIGIAAACVINKKVNDAIREKDFTWRETTCYISPGQRLKRFCPNGRITTDNEECCSSPQRTCDFQNNQNIIVISIGSDGSKFAFTRHKN